MLRYLVLFDIDGTLIWPDGVGKASLAAALQRVFGTQGSLAAYDLRGQTDRQIVPDVLAGEGISPEEIETRFEHFCGVMAEELMGLLPRHDVRPVTGGPQLVERLRAREDVLLGLVTGNFRETAYLKLEAAGYAPEDFHVGAYGSERAERADLPPLAVERAQQLSGQRFAGQNVVVVGDTPADIACARSVSARTVAVATGGHSVEALQSHSPDSVLADLTDTEQALAALLV
jgi:phosphoglycolate phosphatase-like HAD superfamily hydrolase